MPNRYNTATPACCFVVILTKCWDVAVLCLMKSRMVLVAAGCLLVGGVVGNAFTTSAENGATPRSGAALDSQTTFVEMTPCRLVDSRPASSDNSAVFKAAGQLGAATTKSYQASGKCGVPSNATAIGANVTSVRPTTNTYLTVWDKGATRPTASTLNAVPSTPATANSTTVPLSSSGEFSIYNNAGQVHYIVDVLGYYVDGFGTSARPDLTDTGDGFALVFEHDVTFDYETCLDPYPCSTDVFRGFWGTIVNLENEARWVSVVTTSRCPAYSFTSPTLGTVQVPALEPGTIIDPEFFPVRVEARSTTAIDFDGQCGGISDATMDGGGTMREAVAAQTFGTKEFTPG